MPTPEFCAPGVPCVGAEGDEETAAHEHVRRSCLRRMCGGDAPAAKRRPRLAAIAREPDAAVRSGNVSALAVGADPDVIGATRDAWAPTSLAVENDRRSDRHPLIEIAERCQLRELRAPLRDRLPD